MDVDITKAKTTGRETGVGAAENQSRDVRQAVGNITPEASKRGPVTPPLPPRRKEGQRGVGSSNLPHPNIW